MRQPWETGPSCRDSGSTTDPAPDYRAKRLPFRTTPETPGIFGVRPVGPSAKIRQFKDTPREAAAALPTLLPLFVNSGSSYLSFANKVRKDCLSNVLDLTENHIPTQECKQIQIAATLFVRESLRPARNGQEDKPLSF